MHPSEFLTAMAETANRHDFEAHMDLISKKVSVHGVPGFDVITYDDWHRVSKDEFETGLLKRVTYEGLEVLSETPERAIFKAAETIEGSDGSINTNGIEFVIELEDDGVWRVTKETVLKYYELQRDKQKLDS